VTARDQASASAPTGSSVNQRQAPRGRAAISFQQAAKDLATQLAEKMRASRFLIEDNDFAVPFAPHKGIIGTVRQRTCVPATRGVEAKGNLWIAAMSSAALADRRL